MPGFKLLKPYISLTRQAEIDNSYEAYKELIQVIREMSYEELYDLFADAETALKVLCRQEESAKLSGIFSLMEVIIKLANEFMKRCPWYKKDKTPYLEYTYEWIEKNPDEPI